MKTRKLKVETISAELKLLKDAHIKLMLYEPSQLSRAELDTLFHVLSELQAGYDPRPYLGVEGKAGRRPNNETRDITLSAHYWLLRQTGLSAKSAENTIQLHWKVTPRMTKKIAKRHREFGLLLLQGEAPEHYLHRYESAAKFWTNPALDV